LAELPVQRKNSVMQNKFLLARRVEIRPLAGLSMILIASFASNSFAARDVGQMLAQDKANKEVIARRAAASEAGTTSSNAVLPLDHGPRATTTPWLNQQHRLKAEAAASAAKDVSSAGSGTASLLQH
jgi:hypothetical protein